MKAANNTLAFFNLSPWEILFIVLLVGFWSCGQKANPPVQIYGALFEIMHKGDLSSRIRKYVKRKISK